MDEERFRKRLEDQHDFPCRYTFKFIVPKGRLDEVAQLLPETPYQTRPSRRGNYVSVTFEAYMNESAEVIAVYREANKIEELVAL